RRAIVMAKTARSGPKTALITGGTDGLGRAAAILFAERGYRVFAAGRNRERITAIDQLARERKVSLEAIELDVCDNGSVERGGAEVERRPGPLGDFFETTGGG